MLAESAVLLAASNSQGDVVTSLLNGAGTAGIILILWLTGKIALAQDVNQLRKERDEAQAEVKRLRDLNEDRLIPVLTRVADLLPQLVEVIEDERRERRGR